jgi:deoxyribonuclease-4
LVALNLVWTSHTYLQELVSTTHTKKWLKYLERLKVELGADALRNMHIHVSGISSNSKGDLKHLNLEQSDFNWKDMLKALKDTECGGYVICNSPNLEEDAKMMKKYYLAI